ncbi:MAG TPA: ATP synthase F1 subunit gamma [Candidatus Paceibacterota bacterium]|nr:ATP synthase F1 subunit gamma [Candidatus Paceibacterota bacterium]
MALKHVKNKIIATQKTGKVTKAMEAVSAVKMRKSQQRALEGRHFAEAAFRILENISRSHDAQSHSFLTPGAGTHHCVIVVTSDKGLAGNLNSAVIKEAESHISHYNKNEVEIVAFGKKGYEYFKNRGYVVPRHFINISDDIQITDVQSTVTHILNAFSSNTYHTVHIVFQNFISTFEQHPRTHQILPVVPDEVRRMVHDILPREGRYSNDASPSSPVVYITEQPPTALFDVIFALIVEIMVYHALLENKASEHSARMIAMKNATDKTKDMVRSLTLLYNKERQAMITAEVSEITGGIEAMQR